MKPRSSFPSASFRSKSKQKKKATKGKIDGRSQGGAKTKEEVDKNEEDAPILRSVSMGVGTLTDDCSVIFRPNLSPGGIANKAGSNASREQDESVGTPSVGGRKKLLRESSTFLRVADLHHLAKSSSQTLDCLAKTLDGDMEAHYDYPSDNPPPGTGYDPSEAWVALDGGVGEDGGHSKIAPYAVNALAAGGYGAAMDKGMWNADKKTEKLLEKCPEWASLAWSNCGPVVPPPVASEHENNVLIWSGVFSHGLYGSELPTVRAAGIVNMSPKKIVDLLLDSSRVKEYNKMSLGRTDVMVLKDNFANDSAFGGIVTKVVKSESQPPLVRKRLQFLTLMHVRELEDGNGYLIASRAVTQAKESGDVEDGTILSSEILMGVNVIRNIYGEENRALMINVNHIRSPMVPMFIAKKIGLSAAEGFIHDMRALC